MENSLSPSINKKAKAFQVDCYEESGWTTYFEDLSNTQNNSCSSYNSASLVSDAASHAAWKILGKDNHLQTPKGLNFNKKTRSKEILDDDSLEDTASSPVNSPKVVYFNSNDVNVRRNEDQVYSPMGKGSNTDHHLELGSDEINERNFVTNNEYMDLKRRGLCLVPLSALVNNFG